MDTTAHCLWMQLIPLARARDEMTILRLDNFDNRSWQQHLFSLKFLCNLYVYALYNLYQLIIYNFAF